MIAVAAFGLLAVRACAGPTVFDRIVALNTLGTLVVLLVAAVGLLIDRTDTLDIALTYALINFVGTIAALKFFREGHLAGPGT